MATRAIRYDQLNTDSATSPSEALGWTSYNSTDNEVWEPLQVAVQHRIEHSGDTAFNIQTQISNIRNEQYACSNYYKTMTTVYAHLVPQIMSYEMNAANETIQTLMREKLIKMRDIAKANITPDYPYHDARNDVEFTDVMHEMMSAMHEFSRNLNDKYFPKSGSQILQCGVNYSCVHNATTDAEIHDMIEPTTGHWGSLWRVNTYYLLHGGYDRRTVAHQYPTVSDDVMEMLMAHLVENHPAIALRIAQNDQFFQDNPMAQSIGHSWTSRNRSDDCWFKVSHDQVNKMRTVVFAPPRTFFGKFTPNLFAMQDHLLQYKADVMQFLADAKPKIAIKVDAANALHEKTGEAVQNSVTTLVQDLLDDPNTVDIGTAILGQIAGIAHLPIDTSSFPNGHLMYSYHDYTRNQDLNQVFYPQNMNGIVSLTDFNITDEVQQALYEAYRESLENLRTNHANRCAQLARQISQQTTRHDAEVKVIMDAFTAYQTQV